MSANRTKGSRSGPSANQSASHKQSEEEQMDDVLETIDIAVTGATSIPRNISNGNTRQIPALKKIMEAAMDAINTLTV